MIKQTNDNFEKYKDISNKIYKFGFFGMLFISVCGVMLLGKGIVSEKMSTNIFANASAPGSDTDPLVSKSYVDQQIAKYLGEIENLPVSTSNKNDIVNSVVAEINNTYVFDGTSMNESNAIMYVPVQVASGKIIEGGEGAEIILRSGNATAYCPGEDAIVDVTTGLELWNNRDIERNHLILIPRKDGRGVKVTEEAWFMIKGAYTIK